MSLPHSQIELLANLLGSPQKSSSEHDDKASNEEKLTPATVYSKTNSNFYTSSQNNSNNGQHQVNNSTHHQTQSSKSNSNRNLPKQEDEINKTVPCESGATRTKHRIVTQNEEEDIWKENEVPNETEIYYDPNESREIPEYEILYKQQVGTENAYFGMDSNIHPGSTGCTHIVISIKLPKCSSASQLTLEVKPRKLKLSSKLYFLHIPLPHSVDSDKGTAQWIKNVNTLKVTLPIDNYEVDL